MKKFLCLFSLCLFLGGCASVNAPTYSPDYETLDNLEKKTSITKICVGKFEPTDPKNPLNKIRLRANTMVAAQGTFALYIEDALKDSLKDVGILDSNSKRCLTGEIMQNNIDLPMKNGKGIMSVHFLLKDDAELYNKTINVETTFESFFGAMFAIPKGMQEYPNLVRALLKKLFTDKEFVNALYK